MSLKGLKAIRKYETHPGILKINEVASFEKEHFESVVQEIFALNSSKASPMDSIPTNILLKLPRWTLYQQTFF